MKQQISLSIVSIWIHNNMAQKGKKRKAPIFKVALDEYSGDIQLPFDGDIIDYKEITDNSLMNKEDFRIVFDTCIFKKVIMTQNIFKRSEFIDCKFIDCDLSNNEFHSSTFIRCEFTNTRLTGSHFVESFLSSVLIEKSHCSLVDFADCKMELCEFNDSIFNEANFFENDVKQLQFKNLKLEKATFYLTPLQDVDLSSSDIYSIKTDIKSIKGSVISSLQARDVCHLLGIKVND